ncbi:hypothetical protein [Celeribacter sp. ULVN23_4]
MHREPEVQGQMNRNGRASRRHDHTPELLQALDTAGVITAVSYTLKLMSEHPRIRAADWVFNIDVDEFLVVHVGDGSLDALLAQFNMKEPHAIGVHWCCFGDGGQGSR